MSTEITEVCRLVKIILDHGYSITVNDGEDDVVEYSTNPSDIRGALYSTDEDILYFYGDDKRNHKGAIHIIYGNARDGSEIIHDHSNNKVTNEIMDEFEKGVAD